MFVPRAGLPYLRNARIDWNALGPQPKSVPVSLSVLRLSDRATRQRVGSTQQLVLPALVGAQAPGQDVRPPPLPLAQGVFVFTFAALG